MMNDIRNKVQFMRNEAINNIRGNSYRAWCGDSTEDPGANSNYAANRLMTHYPYINPPKINGFHRGCEIYAMGSCFAREVESALKRRSYIVTSYDKEKFEVDLFSGTDEWAPSAFINRYNTASMLLEVKRALGLFTLTDTDLVLNTTKGVVDLHFSNSCGLGDIAIVGERRAITLQVAKNLVSARFVVLTLGLTEAWFDCESGLYMNSAPDVNYIRRTDRFEFRNLNFQENLSNINSIRKIIKSFNNSAQFIVTVSPVPLHSTFTSDDVIVANSRSKSVLRAVADAFCEEVTDAFYFPSYELVMNANKDLAWKKDLRHVLPKMVDHIIDTFIIATHDEPAFSGLLTELPDSNMHSFVENEDFIRIDNGSIMLHPGSNGVSSIIKYTLPKLSNSQVYKFSAIIEVGHDDSEEVSFQVSILSQGGLSVAEKTIVCSAQKRELIDIEIPPAVIEGAVIELRTAMASNSSSNAHAWARFILPKIVSAKTSK